MDDWTLLQEYVGSGSRGAMEELVRRHVGMVHATAQRQLGDAHLAEDVTQAVFMILMRRAKSISPKVVLGGWLFQVTRYAAADVRKKRARRWHHEQHAAVMKQMNAGSDDSGGEELMAEVDEAVASLSQSDRDAVVMKYLEGRSYREVAEVQRITEAAARQRLFRALAKMREYLRRKEIVVTEEVLGTALAGTPGQVKMVELAARINASLNGAAGSAKAAGIAHSTIKGIVMMSKIKIAAVCVVVLMLGVGGATVIHFVYMGGGDSNPGLWTALTPTTRPTAAVVNPAVNAAAGGTYWQGYPTRAPFTAVRWGGHEPQVQVNNAWYNLTAIDAIPIDRIIAFDRSLPQDGADGYRKHFQEDLVEILTRMGHSPGDMVELSVTDAASGQSQVLKDVPMTEENRRILLGAGNPIATAASAPAGGGRRMERAAPFTAVRWKGDAAEVQVENNWYELVALDGIPVGKIVQFAKAQWPGGDPKQPLWKKRMSEDLVEVLTKMDHRPGSTVSLDLRRLDGGEAIHLPRVAMTGANRRMVLEANNGMTDWSGAAK
jgi:RNA polymerase sigma factor (sigma-70 family)